jgi:cell division protein DivIC
MIFKEYILKFWNYFLGLLKNKYLFSLILFGFWLLFFDQNNLMDRYRLIREVNQFEKDLHYYVERIKSDSARLNELRTSPENLEKFAREQYLMKKDDEDIFIIVEDE